MTAPEDNPTRRNRLLAGCLDGGLTAVEEQELLDALQADPAFACEARALRRQDCLLETLLHLRGDRSFVDQTVACAGYSDNRAAFADRVWRKTQEIADIRTEAAAPRQRPFSLRFAWLAAAACLLLGVGVALHAFRQSGRATIARVVSVSPGVRVLRSGTPVAPAEGLPLRIGDSVETGLGQSLVIAYENEATRVELCESTAVSLDPAKPGKQLRLRAGALRATVAPQRRDGAMLIVTAHSRAEVLGTDFSIADEGEATRLAVALGCVKLTDLSSGASIDVTSGFYARAGKGIVLAAKPLPSGGGDVRYVAGRVLFEDTFDKGLGNWAIFRSPQLPRDSKFEPAGESEKKKVQAGEALRDGKPSACLVAEVSAGDGFRLGIRLKEKIRSPAYVAEWQMQYETAATAASLICPGADEKSIRVLYVAPNDSGVRARQWFRQRAEFTPAPDAGKTNAMRVAVFLNEVLSRRIEVAFDRGAVMLDVSRGRALVDKVVIRELVPEAP